MTVYINVKLLLHRDNADHFLGDCQTATRVNIPHFDSPIFWCYRPYKYPNHPNSSLLTLITLYSAFKHISFMHLDAYK